MDVVVVGAGVIGLSVAWRVARAGLAVAVVDPDPGRGASHVAAGMIAPVGEATFGEDALLALALELARAYPGFVSDLEGESGRSTGYRGCGTLLIAADSDERAELRRAQHLRSELGLEAEWLDAEACRRLEPGLSPSIRGGVLVPGDHQVDARAMVAALFRACERRGVRMVRSRAAVTTAGNVTGIRLEDGTAVAAGTVVIAAGCWSASVDGLPPEAVPPVRPVKGQILRLRARPGPPLAERTVRGGTVYIVPRGDGRYVVGATVEERGFESDVVAGAVYELLRDARALLPDVAELELVEASAGLRPGSPDNLPIVGATPVPGLLLATGHHRNGFLLAPLTADAVASALTDGVWAPSLAPFSLARFARAPAAVA